MVLMGLKSKKGAWVKPGRTGGPLLPGSYRGYTYVRAPPKPYPTTSQQKAIGAKGRCVREKCKGKRASDFIACRQSCTG